MGGRANEFSRPGRVALCSSCHHPPHGGIAAPPRWEGREGPWATLPVVEKLRPGWNQPHPPGLQDRPGSAAQLASPEGNPSLQAPAAFLALAALSRGQGAQTPRTPCARSRWVTGIPAG